MPARIVVFGATGFTGRQVAERLADGEATVVLAGRSEAPVRELAERLGTGWATADALRQNSVFALLEPGDVMVSTVGPFARWGEPAARAAISARGVYLDSTGEPAFIRRVFEEFGPAAERTGAALLTAMGYDFVPGTLAAGLALREAGPEADRVDIGYFAFGAGISAGTRESVVGVALDDGFEFRDGAVRTARPAQRLRSFAVRGKEREAVSIGGAEHLGLPAAYPRLREINVYLGWYGRMSRPLQAASLAGSMVTRLPGARGVLRAAAGRLAALGGRGAPEPGAGVSWIVGQAYDREDRRLAEVHLSGSEPYALTAGILAWAARRAAGAGANGTGALGPVAAFGLEALEAGCREAGLERVSA